MSRPPRRCANQTIARSYECALRYDELLQMTYGQTYFGLCVGSSRVMGWRYTQLDVPTSTNLACRKTRVLKRRSTHAIGLSSQNSPKQVVCCVAQCHPKSLQRYPILGSAIGKCTSILRKYQPILRKFSQHVTSHLSTTEQTEHWSIFAIKLRDNYSSRSTVAGPNDGAVFGRPDPYHKTWLKTPQFDRVQLIIDYVSRQK